jgi:RNA polymerase sigma-70 factor (TIGR02943 family)
MSMSASASVHSRTVFPARNVQQKNASTSTDPERWVDDHGDYLFSYATFRMRDPLKSQDAVQETFLAALKSGRSFAGKSVERGWLLGILKNKIHDSFRKAGRETSFTDLGFYEDEERANFAICGLHRGGWVHDRAPTDWQNPGEHLDREEFWRTFRACSSKLPTNISRAFLLREVDGLESRTICEMLNISESNLWVMLHRARMALRRCLETNWFNPNKTTVHELNKGNP